MSTNPSRSALVAPSSLLSNILLGPRLPFTGTSNRAGRRRHVGLKRANTLKLLPSRLVSRLYGAVNNIPLPVLARPLVYGAWSWFFRVNLEEVPRPLSDYPTMTAFFTRRLLQGARPVDSDSPLVSPVDGAVVSVSADMHRVGKLSQVKGIEYHFTDFLGIDVPKLRPGNALYSAILYLSPGDYHRFHSPCEWVVKARTHLAGQLLPVNPIVARLLPSLFCTNERVALFGEWEHGFFSYTAVGATNVGSIRIDFDEEVRTNTYNHDWKCGFNVADALSWMPGGTGTAAGAGSPSTPFARPALSHSKVYEKPVLLGRGDDVGLFELGSTVVLIFEAPTGFEFDLRPGQKVTMGMPIGHFQSDDSSTLASTDGSGVNNASDKDEMSTEQGAGSSPMVAARNFQSPRAFDFPSPPRFMLPISAGGHGRCDCGCNGTVHSLPAKPPARVRARSAFAVLDGVTSWDLHGLSVDLGQVDDTHHDSLFAQGIEGAGAMPRPSRGFIYAPLEAIGCDGSDSESHVEMDDFHSCISAAYD